MSDPQELIFSFGAHYQTKRALNVGDGPRAQLKAGVKLEFREVKYSPYDGCYVYYFRTLDDSKVQELWISEDYPSAEILTWFTRC